jgi:hypothetical protein
MLDRIALGAPYLVFQEAMVVRRKRGADHSLFQSGASEEAGGLAASTTDSLNCDLRLTWSPSE